MTAFQREIALAIWEGMAFASVLIYAVALRRDEYAIAFISALFAVAWTTNVIRVAFGKDKE